MKTLRVNQRPQAAEVIVLERLVLCRSAVVDKPVARPDTRPGHGFCILVVAIRSDQPWPVQSRGCCVSGTGSLLQ